MKNDLEGIKRHMDTYYTHLTREQAHSLCCDYECEAEFNTAVETGELSHDWFTSSHKGTILYRTKDVVKWLEGAAA